MDFKMPSDLIRNMTDVFSIERGGQKIASAHGFFCGKDYPSTIQLVENTTVCETNRNTEVGRHLIGVFC